VALDPEDRERFLSMAFGRQRRGEVFGWSLNEDASSVVVFVPDDRPTTDMPDQVGGLEITVVSIPTPREQNEG
jgi:hypothetical protein